MELSAITFLWRKNKSIGLSASRTDNSACVSGTRENAGLCRLQFAGKRIFTRELRERATNHMKLLIGLLLLAARARTFDDTPEERRRPCGKIKIPKLKFSRTYVAPNDARVTASECRQRR